jgi:pyruvate-formate lyase-activating enzyme
MCAGFQCFHCMNLDSWQYFINAAEEEEEEAKESIIIQ